MDSIYLDHAAATPIRPEVSAAMATMTDRFGNPSSVHRWGREARMALEDARERTAASLRTGPQQVHFVRGGTESINLAILGRVDWAQSHGQGSPRLFHSSLEHPAVREAMETAALMGSVVEVIPISPEGELALPDEEELRARAAQLVSVQWVNQETGLILPIPKVAELCGKAGVPLHVDAVQAAGKIPLELDRTPVALLSLSGHKLGGPRSTGVLVIAEGTKIHARLFGGGAGAEHPARDRRCRGGCRVRTGTRALRAMPGRRGHPTHGPPASAGNRTSEPPPRTSDSRGGGHSRTSYPEPRRPGSPAGHPSERTGPGWHWSFSGIRLPQWNRVYKSHFKSALWK